MSKAPRGLSPEEAALWARVASTVKPLDSHKVRNAIPSLQGREAEQAAIARARAPEPQRGTTRETKPSDAIPTEAPKGLDSHWERRLAREQTQPDFTLDLHGHNLDQAYRRLDAGLVQAKAMGARLVLVVTGKPRPVDSADRAEKRGAIRAKILDWLAAGQHAGDIAAIRNAQRRHGGDGALYIVLKRRRG